MWPHRTWPLDLCAFFSQGSSPLSAPAPPASAVVLGPARHTLTSGPLNSWFPLSKMFLLPRGFLPLLKIYSNATFSARSSLTMPWNCNTSPHSPLTQILCFVSVVCISSWQVSGADCALPDSRRRHFHGGLCEWWPWSCALHDLPSAALPSDIQGLFICLFVCL